jgi:hypothetical protein
VKRRDFLRQIRDAAEEAGVEWTRLRDRGGHEVWSCGGVRIPVPRHRDLNELTVQGTFKRLESVLGEGWWR